MAGEDDRDLASWKEIADYLRVTPRTAQLWEKERGLPVQRVPGGGRVFARTHELDAWRSGPKAVPPSPQTAPAQGFLQWRPWLIGGVAAAIVVSLVTALLLLSSQTQGPPAQWKVVRNTLIVSDDTGSEVWRVTFDRDLDPDRYEVTDRQNTRAWFGDLEGDGTIETLFVQQPALRYAESSALICFSETGVEKWRFVPGRAVSTSGASYANIFHPRTFKVVRTSDDGAYTVIVASSHYLYFPAQIALVSNRGVLQRDYWHAGHLGNPLALEVADLDKNGKGEIYLGGISNARNSATLVVLDPTTWGAHRSKTTPVTSCKDSPQAESSLAYSFHGHASMRTLSSTTASAVSLLTKSRSQWTSWKG